MNPTQVKELASQLETTLRLLAQLMTELEACREEWKHSGVVRDLVHRPAAQPNLAELPAVMLRAYTEITEIVGGIQLTREAIETHAVERIRETKNSLSDVTATTETATLELMNGLDRSMELINSLETHSNGTVSADGFQILRGQVSELYNHLQFQDITTQQLRGVTHSLLEFESRVAAVAALFDHALGHRTKDLRLSAPQSSSQLSFNPDATMKRPHADQATIDETFKGARNGPPSQPASSTPPR